MGPKIKKAIEEAKNINKGVWVAAVVVPGGLTIVAAYLLLKSLNKKPDYQTLPLKEFLKKDEE